MARIRLVWQRLLTAIGRLAEGSRRADARVETVLAMSADWYWETDAKHRFVELLHSGRYDGGHIRDVRGKARWELPGIDTSADWAGHRATLARREPFLDFPYSRELPGGCRRHFLISGRPRYDRRGRFAGYEGIGRNVTQQREAEVALNATESQLAAIIDAAMDAVVTVDDSMRIVLFNECAGRMFRCGRAQALGQPLAQFVPGLAALVEEARACTARPALARAVRLQALRADGEAFAAEATLSRIDPSGHVLHCIVLRDLTDRLAAEKAREELEVQLRQSQKMEAIGTLASGIAHDFNNIVAAILGNAALLHDAVPHGAWGSHLEEISKAGLRARDLVQRLLAFSRRQEPVFASQPLQPVVAEGVQLLRAMLPSGIELVCSLPDEPVHIRADSAQLQQVVMNLGANAWQAIGARPGRIEIAVRTDGEMACLSVTDTGCGMDDAVRQRIFEPFYTTKAKGEGTGLGLAVVHGIVRNHDGLIEVRSQPDAGTRFDIWLPCHAAPADPAPAPVTPAAPPAQGHGQRVLYLDDYPAMVFMMESTLAARGWRVSGFEDAAAALAWLQDAGNEVDVVVTDYNMPGCSGLELTRRVHALRPGVPVIVASGLVTEQLRHEAARLGVAHVFDKAGGPDGLCEAIARLAAPAKENAA